MQHRQRGAAGEDCRQRDHGADMALLGRHIDVASLMRNIGRFMNDRSWSEVPRRDGAANMEGRDHRNGEGAENPEQG